MPSESNSCTAKSENYHNRGRGREKNVERERRRLRLGYAFLGAGPSDRGNRAGRSVRGFSKTKTGECACVKERSKKKPESKRKGDHHRVTKLRPPERRRRPPQPAEGVQILFCAPRKKKRCGNKDEEEREIRSRMRKDPESDGCASQPACWRSGVA